MKELYTTPVVEVEVFEAVDVICQSKQVNPPHTDWGN